MTHELLLELRGRLITATSKEELETVAKDAERLSVQMKRTTRKDDPATIELAARLRRVHEQALELARGQTSGAAYFRAKSALQASVVMPRKYSTSPLKIRAINVLRERFTDSEVSQLLDVPLELVRDG